MAALIKFGLTMELMLLSAGLISTFIMLKKSSTLSEFLNSFKSFLSSPLYISLFINSVVILILTFSKFHHPIKKFLNVFLDEKYAAAAADDDDDIQIQPQPLHHHEKEEYTPNRTNSAIAMDTVMSFFSRNYNSHPPVLEDIQDDMPYSSSVIDNRIDSEPKSNTTPPQSQRSWDRPRPSMSQSQISRGRLRAKSYSAQTSRNFPDISHLTEAREIVTPRSPLTRTNYQENYNEEEELEGDSLEATWKAIIKKKELRKSVTLNDALSMSRIGGLRGEISVTTEESNKRFDDFIKKINRDRLLQRQESDQCAVNNNIC